MSSSLSKIFTCKEVVFDTNRFYFREPTIEDTKVKSVGAKIRRANKDEPGYVYSTFSFTYFGDKEIAGKHEVEKIGDEYIIDLDSKIPVNKLSRNKQPLVNKNP